MKRRQFLTNVAVGYGLVALPALAWTDARDEEHDVISFFVAGARFYKSARDLEPGHTVRITTDIFRGGVCYAVYTTDGRQIGYVPKKLIGVIDDSRISRAYLSAVNHYAVPWKRYEVTLVVTRSASNLRAGIPWEGLYS
jgi:hypothetical protein